MRTKPHPKPVTALDAPGDMRQQLSYEEQVLRVCRAARVLEDAGEYEGAREALSEPWPAASWRPLTDGLGSPAAGELLLRAGALTGRAGSAKQTLGAQQRARKLIVESILLFKQAKLKQKVAEAQVELARCHWREGDFEEARGLLGKALAAAGEDAEGERITASALLLAAVVEDDSGWLDKAYDLLKKSAPLFLSCGSPVLLARFYNYLGVVRDKLYEESGREEYLQEARIDHAGASGLFEDAGAKRLLAQSENNCGLLLLKLKMFDEAAARLRHALDLFNELGDAGSAAIVKDSIARLHIAQGRYAEAARVAEEAVKESEGGGRLAVLADMLTTLGEAQAGLGPAHHVAAWKTLVRAVVVAEETGAGEKAGLAALTVVEKCEGLSFEVAANIYERACQHLEGTQSARTRKRLNEAARKIFKARLARDSAAPRLAERAFVSAAPETLPALAAPELPGGHTTPHRMEGDEVRPLWARRAHEPRVAGGEAPICAKVWEAAHMDYEEFEECAGQLEHDMIRDALIEYKGCLSKAARALGIHRNTLDYRLKKKYRVLLGLLATHAGRDKG